jgi:glucose/arabinose dehydrogenase/PKD repeat protein
MGMRLVRVALALMLAPLLAGLVGVAAPVVVAAPAGFEDALVANLPDPKAPTALAFVAPNRLLITSQYGKLWVYKNGALAGTPALDLTIGDRLCTNSERGLLGVAVDPNFAANHFIYLYYTFKKFGVCPLGDPTNPQVPVNRVARFTLSDADVASGETVLVDNMPSSNGNHNGGDLHFGADGYLYISVGDGGADYAGDSGGAGNNDATRDQFILLGKILRITRDGSIPADNPFRGAGTARCNANGRTTPGNRCQETFAWGLRNPFRFAVRQGTSQLYINDVGQNAWEEIDAGQSGADYGWNCREGRHTNSTTGKCSPTPPNMVDPIFEYKHDSNPAPSPFQGCNSITGGAFVPSGVWPAAYDGAYLFGDFVCGTIFGLSGASATEFIPGINGPTAMIFGPYNATQALYYLAYGSGEVRRVAYVGSANRSPVAAIAATPRFGAAPLVVAFDGRGSSDADGDALAYDWDFGDGSAHASGATTSHQYAAGTFTATLRVTDGKGGSGTATVRIDAGNTPPTPVIESPIDGARFAVGQTITLHGSATDTQDGAVPASRLSWKVWLHHNDHRHPYLQQAGNDITFTAPPPEDLAATTTSYLEIELTASDSTGLASTATRQLRPRLVDITFNTQPSGLILVVNGSTIVAPRTFVSWQGYALRVAAPAQTSAGQWVTIASWSDGGPAVRTIVTPAAAAAYTATFGPADVVFLPFVPRQNR